MGHNNDLSLEQTPTWAVSLVCSALLLLSLIIERAIHHLGNWLSGRHRKALYDALEKLKAELMFLGFISLLLAVGEKPISMICITEAENSFMLPCKKRNDHVEDEHCSKHGMYPLISQKGMNQLHIFIFTLAVIHVLFSGLIVALGRAKMKRWSAWENEIETLDYRLSHDPGRFRLTHQTSFVKRHLSFWSRTPIVKWVVCFFRQFFWSINKVDYLTLRHGFIVAHLASDHKFDFHKYIKRCLDGDFKTVIGISPPLWGFAVAFLLLNVYRWNALFWISFIPGIIVLLVGLKLQLIIVKMASDIQARHAVVKGTPVVQVTDKLFWFGRPELVLLLIHFTLFQNAFEIAFFLWIWWQFGLRSCFHETFNVIITRVAIGVALQFICGYVTLPVYALVTQMGSHMKPAIFEEHIANALRRWHQKARKSMKRHHSNSGFSSRKGIRSAETTPSHGSSPLHFLHNYSNMGTIETTPSRGSSPLRLMHPYTNMGDIQIPNFSPRSEISEHAIATPSHGSSPLHLLRKYNSMSDIETPNCISPGYDQSQHGAAKATLLTEVTKQHSISKSVKTSNLEIAVSSSYPPRPTKIVLITETSGIEETRKQQRPSMDGNTSVGELSFGRP